MMDNAYVIVFLILIINIVYVSFSTIRMILTLKGLRYLAALVSTVEVVVYIMGLSIVLDNLDGIQNIIAYAVGFALGIISGSMIEEKLALGYITVNVVSSNPEYEFSEKLRASGYGVTSWRSTGRDGDRLSLQVLTSRKREVRLYELISDIDPGAFIVSYEPKQIKGGFWVKQVNNRRRNRQPQTLESPKVEKAVDEQEIENKTAENETNDANKQVEEIKQDNSTES